jgi:hyperosmotically inducible protein
MNAGDRIFLRRVPLIAVGVFALGLIACDPKPAVDQTGKNSDSSTEKKSSAVEGGADGSAAIGQTVDDLALNIKIEDALKEKSELKSLAVKVRTAGGLVTLSGTADTAANRELATQVVMNVNGVKSVQNKLAIASS